ncbi:MAG: hypothetical protein ACHQQ3_00830 [Gemmatimonadales bacterium]
MRRTSGSVLAFAAIVLVPQLSAAQAATETSSKVAGGGISLPGWVGKIDAAEAGRGMKLEDAKLAAMGPGMHVTTGPAVMYWNPANKASGDYTVSATFNEAKYMSLNDHPHPYGVFIAGNALDSDKPDALYCMAYGDGTFIFRGFSTTSSARGGVFRPSGSGAAQPNGAVHKAAGKDQPVSQEIGITVKGDKVSCMINGTEVQSYTKAELTGSGKLPSTDGIYGIRFAHNTDAHVSGFGKK